MYSTLAYSAYTIYLDLPCSLGKKHAVSSATVFSEDQPKLDFQRLPLPDFSKGYPALDFQVSRVF